MDFKCTFVLIFVLNFALTAIQADEITFAPEVKTKSGIVRGIVRESIKGAKVHFYQGIRYGNAKRFELPTPVDPWEGVYNATTVRYACPQVGLKAAVGNEVFTSSTIDAEFYSEDCLFLNVWRPASARSNRPVMIWIYGGAFKNGNIFTDFYDGRHLAALGNVVVVSINYRLSSFGFLNVGDDAIAGGNQGLYDQLLGIRWVKENIAHFGGNPANVTIFGESAGSMSVGDQLLSPLTKGLFHRAIMQSGSPTSIDWTDSKERALEKLTKFAVFSNCTNTNTTKVVECLKAKPMEDLVKASTTDWVDNFLFLPTHGNAFLPEHPIKLLKNFNKPIDLLYGIVEDEGSMFVRPGFDLLAKLGTQINIDNLKQLLNSTIQNFSVSDHEAIIEYYSKGLTANSTTDAFKKAISNVWGDYIIACPQALFGHELAKHGNDAHHYYAYKFNHPTKVAAIGCDESWMGTCHFADVIYTFGTPLSYPAAYSAEDHKLSLEMINAWTNYATNGILPLMENVQWPRVLASGHNKPVTYMDIVAGKMHARHGLFQERCEEFWRSLIFDHREQK